jgi:hypothetical protein
MLAMAPEAPDYREEKPIATLYARLPTRRPASSDTFGYGAHKK